MLAKTMDRSDKRFGVIIPTFNAASTIVRALDSVCAAATSTGIEDDLRVVLVDDGSNDETLKRVKRWSAPISVQLLRHPNAENRGVSATRNFGITNCQSEFVCFLDDDDTYCENRFEGVAQLFDTDPRIDAIYGDTEVLLDDDTQADDWKTGTTFGVGGRFIELDLLERLIHSRPWATSAITVRKSLLERTGGFCEELRVAEDCNLWMKMAAAGTVAPGPWTTPISRYHRRSGSLYRVGIENKLHYLFALSEFYHWSRRRALPSETSITIEKGIGDWLDNALIQCRERNQKRLACRLLSEAVLSMPRIAITRRTAKHLAYVLLGR